MAIKNIRCPVCGYEAEATPTAKGFKLTTDPAEMSQICKAFGSGRDPIGCDNLDQAAIRVRPSR